MCIVTTSRFYDKTGYTGRLPVSRHRTYTIIITTTTKEKEFLAKMSTLSRIIAEREALALKAEIEAKRKPKKKAAKRDENGRYVKKEITTPGEE